MTSRRCVDVVLAEVEDAERRGHAFDEHDVVDAERLFERRLAVELGEHAGDVGAALELDLDAQAAAAVGQVLDVGDVGELALAHEVRDAADDALGADEVGQLGDDRCASRGAGEALDLDLGAHADRAAARLVRLADAVVDDDAAAREVGARACTASSSSMVGLGRRLVSTSSMASHTSRRLCVGMLVAMPTAMPVVPLTSRLGSSAGR